MSHNPGSFDARARGCRCSDVANQYGRGAGETLGAPYYVVADDCPMHHAGWLKVRVVETHAIPEPKRSPELSSCTMCGNKRRNLGVAGRTPTCCSATKTARAA